MAVFQPVILSTIRRLRLREHQRYMAVMRTVWSKILCLMNVHKILSRILNQYIYSGIRERAEGRAHKQI